MRRLILPLLLAAPLAAQSFEAGLHLSRQAYPSQSIPESVQPQDKTVVAVRVGYALADLGPALFQVTAVYQPNAKTDMKVDGWTSPTKLGHEYWGLGLMFHFKAVVALGAGLDYRSEKMSASDLNTVSATYGRPWARVSAGYAIPSPLVKPFIGLEVAVPLAKKDFSNTLSFQDQLKTYAPKSQVGIYAGLRF